MTIRHLRTAPRVFRKAASLLAIPLALAALPAGATDCGLETADFEEAGAGFLLRAGVLGDHHAAHAAGVVTATAAELARQASPACAASNASI